MISPHNQPANRRRHRKKRKKRNFLCLMILFSLFLFAITVFPGTHRLTSIMTLKQYTASNDLTLSEYPKELLELYERNPETEKFVLEYPQKKDLQPSIDLSSYEHASTVPLFMQWDQQWGYKKYSGNLFGLTGCGPTCLSMVAVYLTGETTMNPAWMADFATEHGYASEGNGSSWTLFSEGGPALGFDVTEIPLDEQRIVNNLQVGNPIIVVVGKGDFTTSGHFIVMTGYKDGKIQVNDPNSHANSEKLWSYADIKDQIKNLWVFR